MSTPALTPATTLYWRALRRMERRAQALSTAPDPSRAVLLAQATRTANALFWIAYGHRVNGGCHG